MSKKLNLQSYYMTGGVSEGFTIFNALTDHAILSEVSIKEASDFFWSNDPSHPAISRLEAEQKNAYQYDYFNNYNLELDVWRNNSDTQSLYTFYSPTYHTKDEWTQFYKDDDDRQLKFQFTYPSDKTQTLKVVDKLLLNEESFDDLPILDSDED
jgi:hypothetical protein